MADWLDSTRAVVPPMDGTAVPGNLQSQRLAGTGTTESSTSRRLIRGHIHEIVVGATAVRVSFRPKSGIANAVATTSMIIPAYGSYQFVALIGPEDDAGDPAWGSVYVYVEAADGASAYEAHVVQRTR